MGSDVIALVSEAVETPVGDRAGWVDEDSPDTAGFGETYSDAKEALPNHLRDALKSARTIECLRERLAETQRALAEALGRERDLAGELAVRLLAGE